MRIHRNAVSESSLPTSTGFTEVFLDWKIWRNRKETETDTKKDTDRNTDEEIDTENNLRDIQTIAEQTGFWKNLKIYKI